MIDKIKFWYTSGLWSIEMVNKAVSKGVITQSQADEIIKVN